MFCNFKKIIISDNLKENSNLYDLINYTFGLNGFKVVKGLDKNDSNEVVIENLDWAHLNEKILENMPKIDFIIGSDVFFDSKRKFKHFFYIFSIFS